MNAEALDQVSRTLSMGERIGHATGFAQGLGSGFEAGHSAGYAQAQPETLAALAAHWATFQE